jgi:hypothetical protein
MTPQDEGQAKMLTLWLEMAKSIVQLATGALLLPTFFLREILGLSSGQPMLERLSAWLVLAWVLFFVSILAGVSYQIAAARLIGDAYVGTTTRWRVYPNELFWLMSAALGFGLICFMVGVVRAS